LAHPVSQYRLPMFTNTGSVSTTIHSSTYRMDQKIKLTFVHIFTKYMYWWILQILHFTR